MSAWTAHSTHIRLQEHLYVSLATQARRAAQERHNAPFAIQAHFQGLAVPAQIASQDITPHTACFVSSALQVHQV